MKAIIFDFDGTLADSFKLVVEITQGLTHRKEPISDQEIARLRQMRLLNVAKELGLSRWRWPLLIIRGRRLMARRIGEVQPFEGIEDVLRTLSNDHYRLFVMSSNSTRNVQVFLVQHGLSNFFTNIYGGVGLLGKSRALRRILRHNQLQPKDVIYVGDEPRDIEACKRVDVPCVAVAWGFNTPELLAEHAPMVVVRTSSQLRKVLEEWGSSLV
ncbi:MAG: HAD-IA family hydrolase [Candidatus Saccharibacteria bacterium]